MPRVLPYRDYDGFAKPTMSAASIVAIICGVFSIFVGAGMGFLLALVAIVAGVVGVVMSLSPRVRGGMTSIVAVVLGLLGVVLAVLKLIFNIVF